ncbi:MAG: preprotein translocase subunit SecE [Fimbriimonadales bacterium]|nr:preprotein translocase subunit SecE [Fimbriimonadales bacterium]
MASLKTTERPGLIARMRNWFGDIVAELRRVVKPTPEETTQMMMVVIGFVIVVAIWFAFWDVALTRLTVWIEQRIVGQ